ncbi:MAG: alpha/beta hydrolase [Mycoplasmoidaceae bacterium]|nr:MAG: alpha/beta hydrolase [Mycoplasmoidaceae bacterium]
MNFIHKKEFVKRHWYRPIHNKGDFVFVHGFNSTYFKHIDFLKGIFRLGYNVYAFDLPNHGENYDFDKQLSFDEYCKYVIDFIKKYNLKKIHIAGHSMGGGIVSAIQNDKTLNFEKIILIDPLNSQAKKIPNLRFLKVLSSVFPIKQYEDFVAKAKADQSINTTALLTEIMSPEVLDKVHSGLTNIAIPTQLVFGEDDNVIPTETSIKYIKQTIPNNYLKQISIIKNAKHSPTHENTTETLKELKAFLKDF